MCGYDFSICPIIHLVFYCSTCFACKIWIFGFDICYVQLKLFEVDILIKNMT